MKITRSQLRKLINEAVYKFGRGGRTLDYEIKQLDRDIAQSNTRIDPMLSQKQRDNLEIFDEKDPDYAEFLRLSLDPDRPEVRRLRQTFETVSAYRHPENIEIEIPQTLVSDVIEEHKSLLARKNKSPGKSIIFMPAPTFRQAGIRVFHYIEDEVKRIAGSDKNVYEYGLSTRGYRADEYQAAMEAVGEYL